MSTRDDDELRIAVRRLALQFTALIAVLFLLIGTLLYSLVSSSTTESLDHTLGDAARVDSPHDLPSGVWITIVDTPGGATVGSRELPNGLPDADAISEAAETGNEVRGDVSAGETTYRVLTTADRGHIVQVAVSRAESQEELARLMWALIASGVAALAIGAIGAVWMARRAIRPLSDALAMQRRFVADASHELRTPLTLLSTRAQLLRRRVHDSGEDPLRSGLDEIVQDAHDLTDTLDDLLIASDPREPESSDVVDVIGCAREAAASFATQAASRSIDLNVPEAGDLIEVVASRAALKRLFAALIANAIDHASSEINVSVEADRRFVIVVVRDDGPGFPDDVRERAFERFASARSGGAHPAAQRHYGLGLALVADVAARYGGDVEILDSRPGAAIRVRLPLA